jgi:NTE family protein
MKRMMQGGLAPEDLPELIPQALELIRNRGLDVSPLRAWVHEIMDVKKIHESDVDFYLSTVSLSDRKSLEVHVNELPEDEICDMLLASAYHPSFRLEKLGGKLYADGGFVDNLPLHALVENGYRDIIAVRIPSMGVERRFKMPEDANVTTIRTWADLGHVLNFDSAQARRDMEIGYLDARRVLYGLYGRRYYFERTMSEREALAWILDRYGGTADSLRAYLEEELPRTAERLDAEDCDYYELMLLLAEKEAEKQGLEPLRVYADRELLDALE